MINIFQEINTLDIDLEIACDIVNEEDFSLFAITILNLIYIFPKLDYLKLNLINSNLQYFLYENNYKYISNILDIGNESLKKNIFNNNIWIYGNKWDFEHEFNLESYRKKMNIEKRTRKFGKIKYDQYSILYKVEPYENMKIKDNTQKPRFYSQKQNNINDYINNDNNSDDNETRSSSHQYSFINEFSNIVNKKSKEDSKNQKSEIFLIYNVILFISCSFYNFKKFQLISNDFYTNELLIYLKEKLQICFPKEYTKFHFLNLFYPLIKNINLFNLEINSLDDNAFKKTLKILCKNNSIISLKISFFSCDVSYLILGLFKTYESIKKKEIFENYVVNVRNNITYEKIENKIINDLSNDFIENLAILFNIIKNKDNLEILGFNFDLPKILINNKNYINPIYKFIINILLLIDNNEKKHKNKIQKLIILSKNTVLDGRNLNNINDIFKNLQLNKNNKTLKEFNIQCQFYKIIHIKNIISTNLIILSIGDLDFETFSYLVNYITSYEFSNKSSLQLLNIKLMNKLSEFNIKIKVLLQKLFYIKIKNLLELKIFSNLIIKDTFNYLYLIKLLKYNWIPSYVITLNKVSYQHKIDYYNNNVPFLIFPSIGKNSSNTFEIIAENEIINKKDVINDNELFWFLKYIFYCRYAEYNLNFFEIKNIIFNIAQFLYTTCNTKISYEINEK